MLRRARSLFHRRRRARRFAVRYVRDKSWVLPKSVRIGGELMPLHLPDDQGTKIAFKDIFISDVYGLETMPDIPSTVLDIGAHAGLFSLASRAYFPSAEIHAYEPNPSLIDLLNTHAQRGQFAVFAEAVGDVTGRASFDFGVDSVFTHCVPSDVGPVTVTSIREAIDRVSGESDLGLLKLDCEGGEWNILRDRATMGRVRQLTMEYHLEPDRPLEALLQMIDAAGLHVDFMEADGISNGRIRAHQRNAPQRRAGTVG